MADVSAPSTRTERILLVGMGGLGCPASLALVQAGIRRLTLIDPDRVDATNLHRQPWFRSDDVGAIKVEAASRRLLGAFPQLELSVHAGRVDASNVRTLLESHDLTIDGTDSIATKFLLSDAAVLTGRPVIYGGVLRMEGQVMALRSGGPCLRCLFDELREDDVPTCAQAGVLGSVAGLIGALQAQTALELLRAPRTGPTEPLSIFDAQRMAQRQVRVRKAADCRACGDAASLTLRDPEPPRC